VRKVGLAALLIGFTALTALAGCADQPRLVGPAGSMAAEPGSSATAKPPGTAVDKAACAALRQRLADWVRALAKAGGPLATAGTEIAKVEQVVTATKAVNAQLAANLRAEAAKTKDGEVRTVANELAATLDKISGQLDAERIAKDHDAFTAAFDAPEYAAAASNFDKVCG
jgi:hypothetical protein